jgi:excisionase family DNA binding protein
MALTAADDSPQLQTVAEVARLLRVSKASVLRLVTDGELESVQVRTRRLVFSDSVDGYLQRHRDHRGPA